MSHLSAEEFIDFADRTLPRDRAAHLDRCVACRARADVVRDALTCADVPADVPEPSPLFWDQFSARIRDAVARTPPRASWWLGVPTLQPILGALAVLVLIASAVFLTRDDRTAITSAPVASGPASADHDHAIEPAVDPSHAAAWAVLTAAAADLELDEARDAGMAVPSAAVDRAVTQLTRDELSELGRLLQSELKRSSN